MRIFSQRKFINILLLISLIIMAGSVFFSYQQIQKLLETNLWVIHTHEVIGQSNQVLLSLAKAESQANYYVISKDKTALQTLSGDFDALKNNLHLLQQLTIDNPQQQHNVNDMLIPLINKQIVLLQDTTQTNSYSYERPAVQKLNQDIIQTINKIGQEEETLLKMRNDISNAEAKRSNVAVLTTGGLGSLLLLFCFLLLNHNLRARDRAERMRRELEDRLKKIIESSNDLIAALDLKFNLIAFNTAYQNFFEHTFGKKIKVGMNLKEMLSSDAQIEEVVTIWERALQGEEFTIVTEYGSKSESPHYYEATYNTIRDMDNKRIGAAHIVRDITERKKVEKLKSEFVSIVSHELRTPLTAIRGSLGIILGTLNQNFDDKTMHMLNIAYNNCERLVTLINDILDIDKIESGKLDFKYEIFDLNKIAEDAVSANESYAKKFNVEIKLTRSTKALPVRVDYSRLMQVLTNLLSNAAKFSFPKSEVKVVLSRVEDFARVSIIDYGHGIPYEFQKHIFEKFSQAESSATRKHGGSGLGLSISKAIIENLNGRIGFVSNEKSGSTFYFELPIWEEQRSFDHGSTSSTIQHEVMELVPDKYKRILYVEDDNDLANIVISLLDNEADVLNVMTKEAAMKALDNHKFDLILLDLHLPDGLGSDLIPEFKKRNLPIVVFTAYELPVKYVSYVKNILVKSRTSNQELIKTIREAMQTKLA